MAALGSQHSRALGCDLRGARKRVSTSRASRPEQRELERTADGQYVLFCEDQFAGPLLVGTQHSLLAHASHVVARIERRDALP